VFATWNEEERKPQMAHEAQKGTDFYVRLFAFCVFFLLICG